MGAPKGGGYVQKETLNPEQLSTLARILGFSQESLSGTGGVASNPLYQQSAEAIKGFLPGGTAFNPIAQQAQQQFQQQTIPSILNAFGSGNKGSSALNQALASAGQNLNTNLAAQQAQMQLGAAQQASGLAQLPYAQGIQSAGLGLNTSPFAYMQRATPFWQDALLASITAGGEAAKAFIPGK